MLVCSVSMRAPRRAISAELVEAATADDASTTGFVVFATIVDDPANVRDTVDAYLGEIMLEAASATAIVDAGFISSVSIDESVTITDSWTGISAAGIAADVVEAATADSVQDGTVPISTAWDAATVTAVTLSGSNLVATNTGTTSANQGAHVASTVGKTSGKYYFEATFTTLAGGINYAVGVGTTASTYTNMGNSATTGVMMYRSAAIWANGSSTGVNGASGAFTSGQGAGIAVDLDNRKIWFRKLPAQNWNNSGTADPATNTGGVTIPAGTMVPFCVFGGTGGVANNVLTANFGNSAFSGTVPSGFTTGWV